MATIIAGEARVRAKDDLARVRDALAVAKGAKHKADA